MERVCVILSIFLLFGPSLLGQNNQNPDQLRYIERYKDIAMREMERSGVPASIKLAQGLLESDSGRSYLARNGNNHFGIKCGSNWNGKEVYRKDDDYNDQGELIKSCFRGYRNPEASFVAHSEFLRDPKKAFRYGFLFRLNPYDYKRWAEGLRRAGYATNPKYPQLLIGLIERYKLDQYDRPASRPDDPIDIETPAAELVAGILRANDVSYFVSDEALSVEEVARRVDLSVRRLIDYNESVQSQNQQIVPGQRVFLQRKRNSYRGKETYHTVLAGETLQEISDRYAIR
ncbi:MAG: glucosaminidase domain-containing protein, partial [Bacteroidota bacterium]